MLFISPVVIKMVRTLVKTVTLMKGLEYSSVVLIFTILIGPFEGPAACFPQHSGKAFTTLEPEISEQGYTQRRTFSGTNISSLYSETQGI